MKEYNNTKAINYSLLKEYYHSLPRAKAAWERMQQEESPVTKDHFLLGTLVDMFITEPDKIEGKFLITDASSPSESYAALADEYLRITANLEELYPDQIIDENNVILTARDNIGFQSAWKPDTVIKNFWDKCEEYILTIDEAKAEGKTLCSRSIYNQAMELTDQLVNGDYTHKYFSNDYISFNQVEIFWSINGIDFKSKLDRVLVDEDTKQIILTDVKTYNGDFVHNYYEYYYWLQELMYRAPFEIAKNQGTLFPIENFKIEINESNSDLLKYIDSVAYTLASEFIFLTVDKSGQNVPTPFVSRKTALGSLNYITINQKNTGTIFSRDGWLHKASELWKHLSNDQWTVPNELVENGEIRL